LAETHNLTTSKKSSKVPGHGIQAIQKAMMIEINYKG